MAVSGGVDSMALLHHLHNTNPGDRKLIVAHLDHGIREDSADDRQLVAAVAREYGLPFIYKEAGLGAGASEAAARTARYSFLRDVQRSSGARALVTAHHQDDVLETAILNMLRGTGRKGLTALSSRHDVVRPLLNTPKQALIAYAKDQGLRWHEDSTNLDTTYTRNYIRAHLLPRFRAADRTQLLQHINTLTQLNQDIDEAITGHLHLQSTARSLDRNWFNHLPHAVAREVLAGWLRAHGIASFDTKTLERLVVAAKTSPPGRKYPIVQQHFIEVQPRLLALRLAER